MARSRTAGTRDTGANLGFEAKLWLAADKLRNNMDAAEYKHVVLGLIFLKYITDAFEAMHAELEAKAHGADPEDPDEYRAERLLGAQGGPLDGTSRQAAKQPTIGKLVDDAMAAIERDNPSLKGVLPKDYARPGLDKAALGPADQPCPGHRPRRAHRSREGHPWPRLRVLPRPVRVRAEGKQGGEFYTPRSWSNSWSRCWSPYKGRVFDPPAAPAACSSRRAGSSKPTAGADDISVYGQE